MKSIIFNFFLLVSFSSYSQGHQILLIDSLNNSAVSNVLMQSTKGNFYSNQNGKIVFEGNLFDSVYFSHPLYISKSAVNVISVDTIYLNPNPKILEDIVVSLPKAGKPYDLGYYNVQNKNKHSTIINDTSIIAVFVPNTKEDIYIKTILLNLKARKYSESYNVYLYEPDTSGMPGKILFMQNIIVDSLKEEGVIDIYQLKIKIPENGIFIGLENLKIYNYGNEYKLGGMGVRYYETEIFDDAESFILINNKNINPKGIWFNCGKLSSQKFTPCFGLQVYEKITGY